MASMGYNSSARHLVGALVIGAGLASTPPAYAADVTIVLSGGVATLDPHKTVTVGTDLSVISHIYTSLTEMAADLKLKPALATSWEAVDDHLWTFTLKEGVRFENGEPLDAQAVKWNIERVLDPKTAARIRPWFERIAEVVVEGPTRLKIRTSEPYPDLPAQLAAFYLLPPQWAQSHNPSVEAMGSGPYRLQTFRAGEQIVLTGREGAGFEKVTFRFVADASARIAQVLASEADLAVGIPPNSMKRIDDSGVAKTGYVDSTRPMFVKFNMLRPPFKDNHKLVRALNYAVDKQGILDGLWNGVGTLAHCQPLTPAYFGYNDELKPIPYDPKEAKRLLAEAGYPNGLAFEMEVPLGRFLQASDIAQIIASQWGEIGVKVSLKETEYGPWLSGMMAGQAPAATYIGLAWPTLDAGGLLVHWERTAPLAYYDNPALTEDLVKAKSTTSTDTRKQIYKKITTELCSNPNVAYLFSQPVTYATSKKVDWQARGDDWIRAMDMKPVKN